MSVMEISHRSKAFVAVVEQAEQDLRELMRIPSNYKVLFLQGGATGQFTAIPLNLSASAPWWTTSTPALGRKKQSPKHDATAQ